MIQRVNTLDIRQVIKNVANQNSRDISPEEFAQKVEQELIDSRRPAIPIGKDYLALNSKTDKSFIEKLANGFKSLFHNKWIKIGVAALLGTLILKAGIVAIMNSKKPNNTDNKIA